MGLKMILKITVSTKGQIVIPIKKKLSDFFGIGSQKYHFTSPIEVDQAIAEAVVENNPSMKTFLRATLP
jgi:hypothetical protein